MTLLAEISNGMFIGFMVLIGALAWLFGWVLGRMRDPAQERSWHQRLEEQVRSAKQTETGYARNLEATRDQLGKREHELRDLIDKHAHLSAQLDKSRKAFDDLNLAHAVLKTDFDNAEDRIPLLASRIAELEPLAGQVDALRERVQELEPLERKLVDAETSHLGDMARKDEDVDALRRRIADLESELGKREAQIDSLTPYEERYERSESEHRETKRRLDAMTPELQKRERHIESLTPYKARYEQSESEHNETKRELDATQRRLAAIEPEFQKRNARIESLKPFEAKYRDAEERRAALARTYDEAIQNKDRDLERMRRRVDELAPLSLHLQERDERIRSLERIEREHRGCAEEIRRLRDRIERPAHAPSVLRTAAPHPTTPRPSGPRRDDLQKIWGIGKVFERELNEMGYYTFRDVAAWDQEVIETVAKRIGAFPDRIRRDRWIDQAAELATTVSG